jgi:hypothetical protein
MAVPLWLLATTPLVCTYLSGDFFLDDLSNQWQFFSKSIGKYCTYVDAGIQERQWSMR